MTSIRRSTALAALPRVHQAGHIPRSWDARPHLEAAVPPGLEPCDIRLADVYSDRARCASSRCCRPGSPGSSPAPARLEEEQPAGDRRVVRLVPLELVVAHEPALEGPVGRVGQTCGVELVDQTSRSPPGRRSPAVSPVPDGVVDRDRGRARGVDAPLRGEEPLPQAPDGWAPTGSSDPAPFGRLLTMSWACHMLVVPAGVVTASLPYSAIASLRSG